MLPDLRRPKRDGPDASEQVVISRILAILALVACVPVGCTEHMLLADAEPVIVTVTGESHPSRGSRTVDVEWVDQRPPRRAATHDEQLLVAPEPQDEQQRSYQHRGSYPAAFLETVTPGRTTTAYLHPDGTLTGGSLRHRYAFTMLLLLAAMALGLRALYAWRAAHRGTHDW